MEPVPSMPTSGDDAPSVGDPRVEIRTLRAKNRILRAERTAIAGRKYVLETVVEALRQKLDELARAYEVVAGGGDIAEAIRVFGDLVTDARQVAEDREAIESELETERAERLKDRRAREAREFELAERAAVLEAEREALAERFESTGAASAAEVDELRRVLDAEREQRLGIERELAGERARASALEIEKGAAAAGLIAARTQVAEQGSVVDALADRLEEVEKEAQSLATRLGETRARGRVDVKELLVRAALLKRREAKAAAARRGK